MKENTVPTSVLPSLDPKKADELSAGGGVLENITNKIINRALASGADPSGRKLPPPSDFTFSSGREKDPDLALAQLDANFTFHGEASIPDPAAKSTKDKPLRILDMLPSKIQEKYRQLKQQTMARLMQRLALRGPQRAAVESWRRACLSGRMEEKANTAAETVEKMSKVSRSFIALNALGGIVTRKSMLSLSKRFARWHMAQRAVPSTILAETAPQRQSQGRSLAAAAVVSVMKKKLGEFVGRAKFGAAKGWEEKKQKEVAELQGIVKQYSYWEQKINDIEGRLKTENEELIKHNKCLQGENDKLQEMITAKNKEMMEKIDTIQSLSAKLKEATTSRPLEPVSEVVCARCKESMEESRNFADKSISAVAADEEKMKNLEALVAALKEEVGKREIEENKAKKELEEQVDLVLKMEEERLMLMKESKLCKERLSKLESVPPTVSQLPTEKIEAETMTEEERTELVLSMTQEETKEIAPLVAAASRTVTAARRPLTTTTCGKSAKRSIKKQVLASSRKKLIFEKPYESEFRSSASSSIMGADRDISAGVSTQPRLDNKDALTQEIIKSNRENTRLKKELRGKEDALRRADRELADIKKQLSIKLDAVEKLRRENTEMATTLQTDQFKSVRLMEAEKNQCLAKLSEVQKKLSALAQAKGDLELELDSLKKSLDATKKRAEEAERKVAEYREKAERCDSAQRELAEKREAAKRIEGDRASEKLARDQLAKEKTDLEKKVC